MRVIVQFGEKYRNMGFYDKDKRIAGICGNLYSNHGRQCIIMSYNIVKQIDKNLVTGLKIVYK